MRILKLSALIVSVSLLMLNTGGAKMEFSKKEGKACTFCHVKAGSKDLNNAGKFYKEKGTLKGYEEKKEKK